MKIRRFHSLVLITFVVVLSIVFTGIPYDKLSWYPIVKVARGVQYNQPAPPPVVDSDGDGLPDNVDGCPAAWGPAENGGCPWPDSDGDGLTDNVDSCPTLSAPGMANGCPPPLVTLPTDGPCVLSTGNSMNNVNIRAKPDLNSDSVGSVVANTIVDVLGRNADSSWYYLEGGWIAGWVIRLGGDCDALPIIDPDNPVAATPDITEAPAAEEAPATEETSPALAEGEYGLLALSDVFEQVDAVFEVESEGQTTDIYQMVDGVIRPLTENTPVSERFPRLHPNGDRVAYLSIDAQGQTDLVIQPLTGLPDVIALPNGWTVEPYPPAWEPGTDSHRLLVTLSEPSGVPGIYLLDQSYPSAAPQPFVADAHSPVYDATGMIVAFVRDEDERQDIHIMGAQGGQQQNITLALSGAVQCSSPVFGADSMSLYFVCQLDEQQALYLYDNAGRIQPVDVEISPLGHLALIPGTDDLVFDDGTTVYYLPGGTPPAAPLLRLEDKQVSDVAFTAKPQP